MAAPIGRGGYGPHVSPFPVLDAKGRPYDFPFLGGFNLPRPQLVDIDGDGDQDLFVQEYGGQIAFFERLASSGATPWVWRSDRFHDLDVGEWYRFADLDRDGDFDLLAEAPFSFLRYYRNDGTPRAPRFVLAADTLRDGAGAPIFSDRQNIPNAADIDCNGLPDVFLGRLVGTVSRYEVDGYDAAGAPRLRFVTDRFEDIEIVAQFGSLHGANTLTLVDIDGDGDLDLFWGDFFEAGLLVIENTGSCERPNLRNTPLPFPRNDPVQTSGYNAPAFGDVDGDGDQDLLVGVIGGAFNLARTTADNLYFYEQTAPGHFVLRTRRFVRQIDVGSESIPVLVDLDGDGDLDLLVANKLSPDDLTTSRIIEFRNEGSPTQPAFREVGPWPLAGSFHDAPAFGDLDGDGDLDMLLGSWSRHVALYRNDGGPREPRFVLVDSTWITITRGSNTTPALVDIDGDGDLDLVVGEASGELNFYRNDGDARAPRFELVTDRFLEIDVGRRSVPAFADLDGDGDYDLIVGRDGAGVLYVRNDGTRKEPRFVADSSVRFVTPPLSAPAFGDLTGDGRLEVLVGNVGGGLLYFAPR